VGRLQLMRKSLGTPPGHLGMLKWTVERPFLLLPERCLVDELINQVAQRTGLAPEQARTAVDTVLSFLKTRLPAPIASQLDSALSGSAAGGMAEAAKGVGSRFGNK
jgi:hypothetical protein